jgi:carboxyl-terminal processing protease
MGTRSFGKGSVQTITPLPVEGALRLTTSLYYSPSGQVIQARGILPDIILKGEQSEDRVTIQHETDLPHSLSGAKTVLSNDAPVVLAETCAVAPSMLENDNNAETSNDSEARVDTELACALMYLHSGSTSAFLSSVMIQPNS